LRNCRSWIHYTHLALISAHSCNRFWRIGPSPSKKFVTALLVCSCSCSSCKASSAVRYRLQVSSRGGIGSLGSLSCDARVLLIFGFGSNLVTGLAIVTSLPLLLELFISSEPAGKGSEPRSDQSPRHLSFALLHPRFEFNPSSFTISTDRNTCNRTHKRLNSAAFIVVPL
jgi:hypothetical protein